MWWWQNLRGARIRIYQPRWIRNEVIKLILRVFISLCSFSQYPDRKTNAKRFYGPFNMVDIFFVIAHTTVYFVKREQIVKSNFRINTESNFLTNRGRTWLIPSMLLNAVLKPFGYFGNVLSSAFLSHVFLKRSRKWK